MKSSSIESWLSFFQQGDVLYIDNSVYRSVLFSRYLVIKDNGDDKDLISIRENLL